MLQELRHQGLGPRELAPWLAQVDRTAPTRQLQQVMVRRIWRHAMMVSKDPLLGLKVGAALPLQAMNILGLIIIHSASLRKALAATVRYQSLISNSGQFSLTVSKRTAQLSYTVNDGPVSMHPAQMDSVFAGYLDVLYRSAPRLRPESIALPGADKRAQKSYEQHFECRVILGAGQPRICFRTQDLDQPWIGADQDLLRTLVSRADLALQTRGRADTLVDHVVANVTAKGFDRVTCADVARSMGLSTRTLQRRLTDVNTSFRKLVEAARMDEALRLMNDRDLSLSEISRRLGYSEPSAFSFAIRTHFGATPRALRDQIAGPSGTNHVAHTLLPK
ncbi:transcriptional regulator [Bradyrhizobium sp. SSBR45G]|uniref:AraC family transcriptional regulator n=1 Tax=unclassified Bradyrhizobium TaxID=2631580 RepID=UPI002342B48A|nr:MULTISPECIES: AraC family transcriptional regulator [unclassified Bradyrhizobium]GLH77118.1 transcriptional regulator [Bradyrhizobium sp. SSBR45G]GLH83876.1 transcriptional regulator [Bradyrhizobium sp. SSBR45R]